MNSEISEKVWNWLKQKLAELKNTIETNVSNLYLSKTDASSTYVKKSGDTMTGQLRQDSTLIDVSVAPTSTIWDAQYQLKDKNNEEIGAIYAIQNTSGRLGIQMEVAKVVESTRHINNVRLYVDNAGTPIVECSKPAWNKALYSVGDVIITSTNTNPATNYGGTWTLIDKEFRNQARTTTSLVTLNSTNISSMSNFEIANRGHEIFIRARLVNKVAIGDSAHNLLTITLANLGLSNIYNLWNSVILTTDGGNGIAMCNWTNSNDTVTLQVTDVITKASNGTIPANNTLELAFNVPIYIYTSMLDSFCDKFYWKRTA